MQDQGTADRPVLDHLRVAHRMLHSTRNPRIIRSPRIFLGMPLDMDVDMAPSIALETLTGV